MSQREASLAESHALLGQEMRTPFIDDIIFVSHISCKTMPVMEDHVINDLCIVPAVFQVGMALEAGVLALQVPLLPFLPPALLPPRRRLRERLSAASCAGPCLPRRSQIQRQLCATVASKRASPTRSGRWHRATRR